MTTQELKQHIDKVLGNSIRCLLPSYWWKRLFNQVADRIEEVEQSTSRLIDSKVEEVKMPIVESVDELSKLDLPKGSVASVEESGVAVVVNLEDCYLSGDAATDWDKYTVIRGFSEKGAPSNYGGQIHLFSDKSMENGLIIGCGEGQYIYYKIANGGSYYSSLEEVNEYLASGEYRLVFGDYIENISAYVTLYSAIPQPSLYIKGETWTRLLKEGDAAGLEVRELYIIGDDAVSGNVLEEYTAEQLAYNKETVDLYKQGKVSLVMNATIKTLNLDISCTPLNYINTDNGTVICYEVNAVIARAMILVNVDNAGNAQLFSDDINSGSDTSGLEIRELYIGDSLTDEQKAWNLETLELAKQGKAIVRTTLHGNTFILELFNEDNDYQFGYTQFSPSGGVAISVGVTEDGLSGIKIEESHFDSELSTTSINAVQNKVITAALNNKADKVEGKQLSTEDFTTALKTKLEGLNAFDPTEINNKVDGLQNQLNNLVSGDASTAIESFNEITAFLNGVTDSETLDGIIAGIEQQIAAKQEQLVSGETIKTINGQSLLGEGDIEIKANIDTTTLATKEELATLQNEVIANEEVTAAALNDLNDRLGKLAENVQGETVTKTEFETAISDLSNTVLENEEITASALTDLDSQIKEIITRLNNAGL